MRWRAVDCGSVKSDHADWQGLNEAVRASGASHVFVAHAYNTVFRRWLDEQGYDAGIVTVEFGGDDDPEGEPDFRDTRN